MKRERDRLLHGLANAKAKGVRIGRLKVRDSDLIRKLKLSGMTYRQIAHISRCSAGAVGAEMRAWKKEKALEESKDKELAESAAKIKLDLSYAPESENEQKFQDLSFDFCKELPRLEIES